MMLLGGDQTSSYCVACIIAPGGSACFPCRQTGIKRKQTAGSGHDAEHDEAELASPAKGSDQLDAARPAEAPFCTTGGAASTPADKLIPRACADAAASEDTDEQLHLASLRPVPVLQHDRGPDATCGVCLESITALSGRCDADWSCSCTKRAG